MPQAAARLVRICEMGAGCLVPVTARAAAPEESGKRTPAPCWESEKPVGINIDGYLDV